jgi:hypothetical protein
VTRSLAALLGLALLFSVAGPAEVAWAGFGDINVRTATPNTPQTGTIRETDAPDGDAPPDAQPAPPQGPATPQAEPPADSDDHASEDDPPGDDSEDPGEPQ